MGEKDCIVGVSYGKESELYSFPSGHPMNNKRVELFAKSFARLAQETGSIKVYPPRIGTEEELLFFHTQEYVNFVKESSKLGEGLLDYGDTPSFNGVYEASLFPVGNTLCGFEEVMEGKVEHYFNPVGGLHHARKNRAGGFCVFNDAAIAISKALNVDGLKQVAYVDIDAHHGDGVYYGFESDERVIIADIHEDGRYLYPGTGFPQETGSGKARGTKLNIPLDPGSGDSEFMKAFENVEAFIRKFRPELIFFQCGADGMNGDPITQLLYTSAAHSFAASRLHKLAHEICDGRIVAMGGGGYDPRNVDAAWTAVIRKLLEKE
ncbi:MAG: acetoin utilization protein AcuC [Thaumarchaeota archaeon]|nr:acetoin utilization protein AcuC [Nitrososphaerota archaeon]MCL5068403.1 acetoin utilization protein AcuC [Nitrososphaerota archaeon]